MTYQIYHDNGHCLEIEYSYKPLVIQPIFDVKAVEQLVYENNIMITASTCYSDNYDVKDGFIHLGNAKFPMQFKTKGLNETLSVFGQFFMSVELFLDEL